MAHNIISETTRFTDFQSIMIYYPSVFERKKEIHLYNTRQYHVSYHQHKMHKMHGLMDIGTLFIAPRKNTIPLPIYHDILSYEYLQNMFSINSVSSFP